ncbi:hypothetical protein CfE428DRAFT_0886 [Chthoniobacter flavus Ellin428]|uniref:Uncharacterized protein n=1 Tax=Chthoniobacter flavus Ellin428 TaxID=497964 RepID=B4CW49_9BACT|nr:hypothetical protein [Chthoniobacter flavus]EDY21641.1 hypothetical protein CfE428DRAFT_0886 [Chthoniobacter flavus Ellin428]TCO95579.1 hypothetical protein EV701_101266 [Chthoniobacter flavus]
MGAPRKLPSISRRQVLRRTGPGPVPVIGLEAEFTLYVDDVKRRPEEVFGNAQKFVRQKMLPRKGRSFQLPVGGAVYFDTGVIEVATPIIEIESGCAVRAGRTLWEQLEFVRGELDAWETDHGQKLRLEGFSTHYNVSVPVGRSLSSVRLQQAARMLTYLLHPPVMLLAANKLSTGIGVRPRGDRLEVTADFTPDPDLMIATTSLVTGIILAVLEWPVHTLAEMKRRGLPIIAGFSPCKHTSRKGFLARHFCFPRNPFAADVNEPDWRLVDGRHRSLRQIALEIALPFREAIGAVTDTDALTHVFEVLSGRARSLLDFPTRPTRYEDAGRRIEWNRRNHRTLPRSRYEQIIHRVLTHRPIRIGSALYDPERMIGWHAIAFRNRRNGRRRTFTLDELAAQGLTNT